jgi:hypothetical protein
MEVFVDSQYARIWTDSETPLLFYMVKAIPDCSSQVNLHGKKYMELLKKMRNRKGGIAYSITDFTLNRKHSAEQIRSYINQLIQFQTQGGVTFMAFAIGENESEKNCELLATQSGASVGVFKSFSDALAHINRERQLSVDGIGRDLEEKNSLRWWNTDYWLK